jgi:spermidine synthase
MRRLLRLLVIPIALAVALAWATAQSRQQLLHHRTTPYGQLYVYEEANGLRTLRHRPGGARQSVLRPKDPDHLELGYTRLALAGLALVPAPRRILVVGLGGGALPRFLHRNFPEAAVDVVEIDAEVLQVAVQYFGFPRDPRLGVHIEDGRLFIARAPAAAYDVIVLDAFADKDVPRHLTTVEFLRGVRRTLSPDGVVVSNVWNRANNPRFDDMLATYRDVFGTVRTLAVGLDVNVVVLSHPRATGFDRDTLAAAGSELAERRRLRFDLGEEIRRGWFEDGPGRGRALRDR